jgi:endonuclease/exonuclease/phosphatase family metal-dependent hydrolase
MSGGSFRIATFNVLCGDPLTGTRSWPGRLPLMRRSIEAAGPDVLGLQEVLPSKLADAADIVAPLTLVPGPSTGRRWYDASIARSERNRAGEHLPIAYRSDRIQLLDSGGFWISGTPDRPGSKLPLASTPFLVHWARLAFRGLPGSIRVMNGHFGHAPWHHAPTARVVTAQLDKLEAAAKDTAQSVFLVGDFNAVPSSQLLGMLTSKPGAGFVNAGRSAAERAGPPVTYHWGRGATRLGLTLDYVLARTPLQPARAEVIDTHDGRRYPSDHHLLVVEFVSPRGG